MITVISKFEVRNGMEEAVKEAYRNRPRLVENAKGFIRLDVLGPVLSPAEIHLITYWDTIDDFEYWHSNHLRESHQFIPKGLKIIPERRELIPYEHITT